MSDNPRTLAGYLSVMLYLTLVRVLSGFGVLEMIDMDTQKSFALLVQPLGMGLIPLLFMMFMSDRENLADKFASVGKRAGFNPKVSIRAWIIVIAVSVMQIWINSGVSFVWNNLLGMLGYTPSVSYPEIYDGIGGLLVAVFFTAMLPGFFEEFTHRGMLLKGLGDNVHGAVIMSALFFALMHQNILQTGYTFAGGIIFGYLAIYTGSIFPAMFAHFLNNLISVLYDYSASIDGMIFRIVQRFYDFAGGVLGMIATVVAFAAIVALTVILLNRLRKMQTVPTELAAKPGFSEKALSRGLLITILVLGVSTTLFSLVWGILR